MSAVIRHLKSWLFHSERWSYSNDSFGEERRATISTLKRVLSMLNGDVPPCVECLYKKEVYKYDCTNCDKIEVE